MPPTNANVPLCTTDHDPSTAPPRTGVTADFASGSPPADGNTGAYVTGQSTEPKGTVPERGPASVSVPGYEIEGVLGRGGMGVVYKARHLTLKRTVALKMVLAGGHAGPHQLARFRIEAEAVARLQHPNIVQIHEVGEADGLPYCSLEFVEGGNLSSKLAGKPMPPRDAAKLVESLARAMQLAHSRNVVHRDLKPANILLTADGTPKITDFGLARQLDSDSGETHAGTVMGTPSYMAPEQASGRAHEAGPAADVYALGAILYDCLAGRPPFKGKTIVETLDQVRTQEPAPLSRWQAGVSLDLETICLKCLRKEPEKRYASAAELADELVRYQQGEPILARPVGRIERTVKWVRRNPVVTTMAAAVTTLLVAVAVAATVAALYFSEQALTEKALKTDAEQAKANAEDKTKESRRTLTDMYTSFGLAAGARDDPRQAALWFAYAARLAGDDRERADANRIRAAAWGRQAIQPVRALVHPAEWIENNMAFHPGGRHLLTHGFDPAAGETTCRLWDLEREAAHPYPGNPSVVSAAAWDATGERLAVGTPEGEVTICRFPSGERLQRVPYAGRIARLLFSPDGRYCAVAAANRVRVWDCRQAAFATPLLEHPAPVTALAFQPQGELLATGCRDKFCRIFAVPTEQNTPLFSPVPHLWLASGGEGLTPIPPLFLDEGRGLLSLFQGEVSWRDSRSGRILRVLPFGDGHGKTVEAITLSGDGKHLVLAGRSAGTPHSRIYDVATAQPVSPGLEHRARQPVLSAAFSPDGHTLVTGSGDHAARLWSVPGGKLLGGPLTHPTSVTAVAFAPDGRHLATAQRGGLIRLWALPPHSSLFPQVERGNGARGNPCDYRVPIGANSFVQLSRDGRLLLPTGLSNHRCELRSTQVFDVATGQHVGPPLEANGMILDAAFSPAGHQVAAAISQAASFKERGQKPGQQAGQLLLWDWRTGKPLTEPLPLPSEPRDLDYSPDGRQLAVICAKGELVVIDPATGKALRQWQAHPPRLAIGNYINNGAVRFSPDNHSLLTFGTNTNSVRVWDALTGQPRHELNHKGKCDDVQFSPDGRLVASAGWDNRVCVWELATGEQLASLAHPDWPFAALFSPDGQHLLTGCRDGMARLWDWRAGHRPKYTFEHEHEVHAVAFTPDGRHVLSASDDGVLKIWEWRTGKPVCPPLALGGAGLSLAVTPDGRWVAVGGFMNELKVFHLDDWLAPAPLEPDDLCLWGEIVSGQRIEDGGVTNLTVEEWLERWQAFRRRHPGYGTHGPPVRGQERRSP